MELVEMKISKEKTESELSYLKYISERSGLIIKSDHAPDKYTFLNFKSGNGKVVKNPLNRFGLNSPICIPNWAVMVSIESLNPSKVIQFKLWVEY